jgi:hypothetical protein
LTIEIIFYSLFLFFVLSVATVTVGWDPIVVGVFVFGLLSALLIFVWVKCLTLRHCLKDAFVFI